MELTAGVTSWLTRRENRLYENLILALRKKLCALCAGEAYADEDSEHEGVVDSRLDLARKWRRLGSRRQ